MSFWVFDPRINALVQVRFTRRGASRAESWRLVRIDAQYLLRELSFGVIRQCRAPDLAGCRFAYPGLLTIIRPPIYE